MFNIVFFPTPFPPPVCFFFSEIAPHDAHEPTHAAFCSNPDPPSPRLWGDVAAPRQLPNSLVFPHDALSFRAIASLRASLERIDPFFSVFFAPPLSLFKPLSGMLNSRTLIFLVGHSPPVPSAFRICNGRLLEFSPIWVSHEEPHPHTPPGLWAFSRNRPTGWFYPRPTPSPPIHTRTSKYALFTSQQVPFTHLGSPSFLPSGSRPAAHLSA